MDNSSILGPSTNVGAHPQTMNGVFSTNSNLMNLAITYVRLIQCDACFEIIFLVSKFLLW